MPIETIEPENQTVPREQTDQIKNEIKNFVASHQLAASNPETSQALLTVEEIADLNDQTCQLWSEFLSIMTETRFRVDEPLQRLLTLEKTLEPLLEDRTDFDVIRGPKTRETIEQFRRQHITKEELVSRLQAIRESRAANHQSPDQKALNFLHHWLENELLRLKHEARQKNVKDLA